MVERGLARSRSQAQEFIEQGLVSIEIDGKKSRVEKSSLKLAEDIQISVLESDWQKYVSRAGLKLVGALEKFEIEIAGRGFLDLGQSTGGFTQVLLEYGAEFVLGIEVGHGQLDKQLRDDGRVAVLEKVNVRELSCSGWREEWPASVELSGVVADLSFISLSQVWAPVFEELPVGLDYVFLVKPQFELERKSLSKKGVVKNTEDHDRVLHRLKAELKELGAQICGECESVVLGGDGNKEFFLHVKK